jgi:anti-sigma factor RsiW
MNCRKIQEIILTDYIDDQLDQKRKCFIDEHLEHCHQCREFAAIAQERLVKPFSNAEKQEVPAIIWDQVKESIAAQQEPKVSLIEEILERLRQVVSMPRPVFAMASLVTLVLMISILPQFMMSNPAVKINGVGQVEYLSYLTGTSGDVSTSESADLGTPIEKYFL